MDLETSCPLFFRRSIGGFRGGAKGAAVPPFFLLFSKCFWNVNVTLLLHVLKSEVFIRGGGRVGVSTHSFWIFRIRSCVSQVKLNLLPREVVECIKEGEQQICNIMDRVKSTALRLTGRCITLIEKSLEPIELSTTFKCSDQKKHRGPMQLFASPLGFGK